MLSSALALGPHTSDDSRVNTWPSHQEHLKQPSWGEAIITGCVLQQHLHGQSPSHVRTPALEKESNHGGGTVGAGGDYPEAGSVRHLRFELCHIPSTTWTLFGHCTENCPYHPITPFFLTQLSRHCAVTDRETEAQNILCHFPKVLKPEPT